jgi:hypothetical protein
MAPASNEISLIVRRKKLVRALSEELDCIASHQLSEIKIKG